MYAEKTHHDEKTKKKSRAPLISTKHTGTNNNYMQQRMQVRVCLGW